MKKCLLLAAFLVIVGDTVIAKPRDGVRRTGPESSNNSNSGAPSRVAGQAIPTHGTRMTAVARQTASRLSEGMVSEEVAAVLGNDSGLSGVMEGQKFALQQGKAGSGNKRKGPTPAASLRYAAGKLSNDLLALAENTERPRKLGLNEPDFDSRIKELLASNIDTLKEMNGGKIPDGVESFSALVGSTIKRIKGQVNVRDSRELKKALKNVVAVLDGLSEAKYNDGTEFFDKARKQLDAVDVRKRSLLTHFFSYGGIAAFAGAALHSLTQVAFRPLPTELSTALLHTGSDGFSQVLPWAFIALGTSMLGILAGEYMKPKNPFQGIPKPLLFAMLPPMAFIEEVIFRAGLTLGGAALLSALSMPILPAILTASVGSSVIFARVHGYGAMVPRVLSGLLFGYLTLTHGLLFASAVHALHNAFALGYQEVVSFVENRTRKNA